MVTKTTWSQIIKSQVKPIKPIDSRVYFENSYNKKKFVGNNYDNLLCGISFLATILQIKKTFLKKNFLIVAT